MSKFAQGAEYSRIESSVSRFTATAGEVGRAMGYSRDGVIGLSVQLFELNERERNRLRRMPYAKFRQERRMF